MSHFRGCFDKQYGKPVQTVLKSSSQLFYYIHWSLARKLCSKKSLLLTCRILGLVVNTLATDEKYPLLNRYNLTIPIRMQLSQKQKTVCELFVALLKSNLNIKNFEKKDDPHSFRISEITGSKNAFR